MSVSAMDILLYLERQGYRLHFFGDSKTLVEGFSSLKHYRKNTLTWLKNKDNWIPAFKNQVNLCIVQEGIEVDLKNQIVCENSKGAFFSTIEFFWGTDEKKETIGANTVIGEKVKIGTNVFIGSNCSIMGDISIGDNTIISDNVVIKNRVSIGSNCEIQALSVIGEEGFGYYEDERQHKTMVRHHGGVTIGNNVFIGSHVNIARGVIDDTVISDGVKIAPSTHIGHNNLIERNAVIICSQLYGSVCIGENAYVVGSIVRNQCIVGNDSMVGMGSVVTRDIENNKVAVGIPAKVIRNNDDKKRMI